MNGPLYDQFKICDRVTGDVIWCITPKSGHTGKAEICGSWNNFESAIDGKNMTEAMNELYAKLN
jgi:hypothetical protein